MRFAAQKRILRRIVDRYRLLFLFCEPKLLCLQLLSRVC
jgi:hypothetical protein